jgi:hypothetical protein
MLMRLSPMLAAVALWAAAADAAASPSWFVSPRASAGCFVSIPGNKLMCRRGKLLVSMGESGRARKGWPRAYQQPPPLSPQLLYLGNEWSDGDFTCKVSRPGLTCRNGSRHGWFIGKSKFRIF